MNKFEIGDKVILLPSHPAGAGCVGMVNSLPQGTSPFYDVRRLEQPNMGYYAYEKELVLVPSGSTQGQVRALLHILGNDYKEETF